MKRVTEPIRIGIVGAGRIVASEHVPRFRAIDGVELVGVANRSEESARRAADELGLARAYPSWQALVADPDLDAVLVGAWPILHAPVTIAALEAGKHVLTEARMAATAEDARAMVRAARAHPDQVATVVPATFSSWADATIVRLLREGAIGRVRHVQVAWDASGPGDPGDFWRWQKATERRERHGPRHPRRGDGPLARPARGGHRGHPPRPPGASRTDRPDPADVPDHVLALVEYPDDVTATVEMSARTNGIASDHATFHGTTGSLVVDLGAQRIELVRGTTREPVDDPRRGPRRLDRRDRLRQRRSAAARPAP